MQVKRVTCNLRPTWLWGGADVEPDYRKRAESQFRLGRALTAMLTGLVVICFCSEHGFGPGWFNQTDC